MRTLLFLAILSMFFSCKTLKKDANNEKSEKTEKTQTANMEKIDLEKITGKTFYWTNTKYNDGTTITPKEKSSYIIFDKENKLKIQSDCNSGSASFTLENYDIKISPVAATKKYCPESTEKKFFSGLMSGVKIFMKDNKLYIDLKADSGTMEFISE